MEAELIWVKSLETKKVIRKQVLERRAAIRSFEKEIAESEIFHKILELKEYREAETILLYASCGSEVSTTALISHSLLVGKQVFLPRVSDDINMEFYQIRDRSDLLPGRYGILEPVTNKIFSRTSSAFMILPLVAFDEKQNRLGYGKGYYDRYLGKGGEISTCGIAFECQKWEEGLPAASHDFRPEKIVTDKRIYVTV